MSGKNELLITAILQSYTESGCVWSLPLWLVVVHCRPGEDQNDPIQHNSADDDQMQPKTPLVMPCQSPFMKHSRLGDVIILSCLSTPVLR